MQQVIHIHGGDVFPNMEKFLADVQQTEYNPFEEKRNWRDWIKQNLIATHQMIIPTMPNARNASYLARKIWFEKLFPYLNNEGVILIGHSLGGTFLIKYLSENFFPVKIQQLHLVAGVLDDEQEYLGDFLPDIKKISQLAKEIKYIYIYHSTDDPLVPYSHAERLAQALPQATLLTFEDRGHFRQTDFPELLANITAT